jgi:hypothetical protein
MMLIQKRLSARRAFSLEPTRRLERRCEVLDMGHPPGRRRDPDRATKGPRRRAGLFSIRK